MYKDFERRGITITHTALKNNVAISHADGIIFMDATKVKTSAEECTVLAHEDGHFISGAFYCPYSPYIVKEQSEYKATKAAVLKYIPLQELKACFSCGLCTLPELAEYFGVTEKFVLTAYYFYKEIMGVCF